jgi:peptidoglycan/LPS O-acetylase OafA/YrhL
LVDGATSREQAYAVSGAGGHGEPTYRARATLRPARVGYLDDLKTVFVAGVIAFHAVVSYATVGSWPYQDVQESRLSAPSEAVVVVIFGPPAFFLMGVFFLLSGLVGPGSVDRKGIARFVRDRLLRLGVPVVVMTVLVWPLLIAGLHRATGDTSATYVSALVHATPLLDWASPLSVETSPLRR